MNHNKFALALSKQLKEEIGLDVARNEWLIIRSDVVEELHCTSFK